MRFTHLLLSLSPFVSATAALLASGCYTDGNPHGAPWNSPGAVAPQPHMQPHAQPPGGAVIQGAPQAGVQMHGGMPQQAPQGVSPQGGLPQGSFDGSPQMQTAPAPQPGSSPTGQPQDATGVPGFAP